jgi:hypothetical protein
MRVSNGRRNSQRWAWGSAFTLIAAAALLLLVLARSGEASLGSQRSDIISKKLRGRSEPSKSMWTSARTPARAPARPAVEEHAGVASMPDPSGFPIHGRVLDASGGPIGGAKVSARPPRASVSAGTARSDDAGEFTLRAALTELVLLAEAEGYSRGTARVFAPASGVLITLAPAAEIVGHVERSDTGEPVTNVTVSARPVASSEEPATSASSASDGAFRLTGLRGGRYELNARSTHWGSAPAWVAVDVGRVSEPVVLQVSPATTLTATVRRAGEPCEGARVELSKGATSLTRSAAGGVVQLEGLAPGAYLANVSCPQSVSRAELIALGTQPVNRTWDLETGLELRGRVETPSGTPVPLAEVRIAPKTAPERRVAHCTSDERGAFTCGGLFPGDFECSVSGGGMELSVERTLVVLPGTGGEVVLRTAPLGDITARVSGAPREQAFHVLARGRNSSAREAVKGEDTFRFERLPLGRYDVYIDLPGMRSGAGTSAELTHDGHVAEVELTAPPAESIMGHVLDERGGPVIDAWVRAAAADLGGVPQPKRAALTDDEGAFTLSGLAPGAYELSANTATGTARSERVASGSSNVALRLVSSATLSGDVYDAVGARVPSFTLFLQPEVGPHKFVRGAHGHWEVPWLVPGRYRVAVAAKQGRAVQQVVLLAGEVQQMALTLARAN